MSKIRAWWDDRKTAAVFYAVPVARAGRGHRPSDLTYRSYRDGLTERTGDAGESRRLIRQWAATWPDAFSYNPWWAYGNARSGARPSDLHDRALPQLRALAADNLRLAGLLDEIDRGRERGGA